MVQLTDYTVICRISSMARFCLALGLVTTSKVGVSESVCGVRQVLRTMVDNSSISVAKEWASVPSSSMWVLALRWVEAERRAGATMDRRYKRNALHGVGVAIAGFEE